MFKLIFILFIPLLLCCQKEQQAALVVEEKSKEIRLETEYEKIFRIPITDFELLIASLHFGIGTSVPHPIISVTRTEIGAVAEHHLEVLDAELDMGEWLDFINNLRKINIGEWEKEYGDINKFSMFYDTAAWELKIFFSNEDKPFKSSGRDDPPNWSEFIKIMDGMKEKIRKKSADRVYFEEDIKKDLEKAEAMYKLRFGEELPDWKFRKLDDKNALYYLRKALKTGRPYFTGEMEITLKELLEKNESKYEKMLKKSVPDYKILSFEEQYKRLDIATDARSPYLTTNEENELEIELKWGLARYEKRFGVPITDFELSTTSIYFGKGNKPWDYAAILVTRTATGALATYLSIERYKSSIHLEISLTLEEWLFFLNNLRELHIDEWEEKYLVGRVLGSKFKYWEFIILPSNKEMLVYDGLNAYPPNWDGFIKIMDDMEARIKKDGAPPAIPYLPDVRNRKRE